MSAARGCCPLLLVLLACATTCGCRNRIDLTAEGLLIGEIERDDAMALTLDQALPWMTQEMDGIDRFNVIAGRHRGEVLVGERERKSDRVWLVRMGLDGAEEPIEEQTLTLDGHGAMRLGPIVKHDRALTVEMDPLPIILPKVLRAGEPVTTSVSMRLPTLGNPKQLRGQGSGEVTVELLGMQSVRMDESLIRAFVVREVFTTDLSISTSRRQTDRWFVPEKGLVLERWEETVRAFGLVIERSSRTIYRSD